MSIFVSDFYSSGVFVLQIQDFTHVPKSRTPQEQASNKIWLPFLKKKKEDGSKQVLLITMNVPSV